MLIFNGYGVVTVIIGISTLIGFGVASKNELITQYLSAFEAGAIICCIAALLNVRIGVYVNSKPGRVLIDPKTMEKVEIKDKHTFFWLPMEYWSFAFIALGVMLV